jgi:hypothetical protein
MPFIHKLKNAWQAATRKGKTAENILGVSDAAAIRLWPRPVSE